MRFNKSKKMKVLFAFKESPNENLFVYTLRDALLTEGIEAKCSVDDFWDHYENYDIIHFHWLMGHIPMFSPEDLDKFIRQLSIVKTRCKIVVTCHDLKPHYSTNKYLNLALNHLYEHCDAMIHLGQYSYDYFASKSDRKIKHYIIPHHIYNKLYDFSLDKLVARKQLKISSDANVLLCFGSFRSDVERNLVLNAWEKVKLPNKYLLAPGFYRVRRNIIIGYKQFVQAIRYRLLGVHFNNNFIQHDMVEKYLCAADVLMIQRAEILNSGNLPLGFHAQRVVVGPNVGNVREILENTGNPTFDPHDIPSVTEAIQKGFHLKETNLPQRNHEYAMRNWNVSKIACEHIGVYKDIIIKNVNE